MNYDLIVIGAGAGGLNVASFMNKSGFSVLLIEKEDKKIGGDCLNTGCIPSKSLIHISKIINNAKQSERFGLKVSGKPDIKKIISYVEDNINYIRKHENAEYFREKGIEVILGTAKFNSKNSIIVNGKEYFAKKIVLATGSKPRKLKIPGVEKIKYLNNESVFNINHLPKNILFIGGGPIGLELGQALNRIGSKVSILETGPKFLSKENPEISKVLFEELKKEGISFYFNTTPIKFISKNKLVVKNKNVERSISFDAVFVGIGRELDFENLDLEKAGIELDEDKKKIKVDDYLRTTNKDVLLSGDIAGGFQFTHASELHAKTIINNFFSPLKKKLIYDNFSWVTYTSPEIANFGLSEIQLNEKGINYEKLEHDLRNDDRAITDDYKEGKAIFYISKNKLLGGSMIANNAGELIQELILANSTGMNIKHIVDKIYPYPTASRINKSIISRHLISKLTPFKKKILRFLY